MNARSVFAVLAFLASAVGAGVVAGGLWNGSFDTVTWGGTLLVAALVARPPHDELADEPADEGA
jgi:hypothetical protein